MAFFKWLQKHGFTQEDFDAATVLGLESPADLAYAFTGRSDSESSGLFVPWQVARRDAHAYAYTSQ